MKKKFIKKIVIGTMLSALAMPVFADPENVWLRAYPCEFTIWTNQDIEANAQFHVKIYNPTDQPIKAHYRAYVCAEQHENRCAVREITKTLPPKQWVDDEFTLATALFEYKFTGVYKVTAAVEGDGTQHVEHTRYGQISVYQKPQ